MKKIILIFILININNLALSSVKENIIISLVNTNNLSFNFEQNINGKIETGNCIIEYPKKIFCEYDKSQNKILVANGKSLVIKTENGSYYHDKSGSDCDVSSAKSDLIEENLLGGTDSINDKIDYNFCVSSSGSDYKIKAEQIKGTCKITMDKNNVFTKTNC